MSAASNSVPFCGANRYQPSLSQVYARENMRRWIKKTHRKTFSSYIWNSADVPIIKHFPIKSKAKSKSFQYRCSENLISHAFKTIWGHLPKWLWILVKKRGFYQRDYITKSWPVWLDVGPIILWVILPSPNGYYIGNKPCLLLSNWFWFRFLLLYDLRLSSFISHKFLSKLWR